MNCRPETAQAYRLLHEGTLALAKMEEAGIRVDVGYVERATREMEARSRELSASLKQSDVWKTWTRLHGSKAKLSSREQLADVFFRAMGNPCRDFTETGKPSTEESAFVGYSDPFIRDYFQLAKTQKVLKTYLNGISREVCGGYIHPGFLVTTTRSYRSSSADPNFQNIPTRDPILGPYIRKAYIPRTKKRRLVEVDIGGAEVKVAYCYHRDPTMKEYLLGAGDMHGDMAEELFQFEKGFCRTHKAWAKKTVRDWSKNRFVFPQFYGSVYFQCAPHIWEAVSGGAKMPDGTTILDHLASKGITACGACDPKARPVPGTFEHRVRQVESSMWSKRFTVYSQWKERHWANYLANGYFDLNTGFRCHGLYKRNQVINYPVQGAAFHILLWALTRVSAWLERYNMETLLIGQIHDSLIADVAEDELQDYLTAVKHAITVACPKAWPWITIPIEVEAEVCEPGASWDTKKVWTQDEKGVWGPPAAAS